MHILCLGDSITDCNHLFEDFPLGNGYVQLLAEKLPYNVQIKNHGIDGFTVSRILENIQTHRISLHRTPAPDPALPLRAAYVCDSKCHFEYNGLQSR